MSYEVRMISLEKDKPYVKSWWFDRFGMEFSDYLLSAFGSTATYNGSPVAIIFAYPTIGSTIATVGFPVTDPSSHKVVRDSCLNLVYKHAHDKLKTLGYKNIWTVSGIKAVKERLDSFGYVLGDENINQYWKKLED